MSTAPVDRVVRKLARLRGISIRRAYLDVAGPFPIAGPANWSNDWHAFRPCPWPHLHEGLDMFAARGTPVVAVAKGQITQLIDDDVTGLGIILSTAGGMDYLYAHLTSYARRAVVGRSVTVGQVIGFVGNTGDAAGGPTHLHFQAEPGGIPMPPKPLVDRWVQRELRRAHDLLAKIRTRLRAAGLLYRLKFEPAIEVRWPAVAPYRPADHPPLRTARAARADRAMPRLSPTSLSVEVTSAAPLSVVGMIVALLMTGIVLRARSRSGKVRRRSD